MLKPPSDAEEAFGRLAPDLEEITDFITNCPLSIPERMRLANLLGDYFHGLAASCEPAGVHAVGDTAVQSGSNERPGTV
jgi:hypothetical protein